MESFFSTATVQLPLIIFLWINNTTLTVYTQAGVL